MVTESSKSLLDVAKECGAILHDTSANASSPAEWSVLFIGDQLTTFAERISDMARDECARTCEGLTMRWD